MSIDPANHNWEKQLEKGFPDCRLRPFDREKKMFRVGRMMWDIVYCAQCHEPYGACPPNVPHVFFICDRCVLEKGPPPDCVQVT